MRAISATDFAGANSWPAAIASPYLSAWLMNPTFGFGLNTFSNPAVVVHTTSQVAGAMVTRAKRSRFILNSTTVHSVSAIAASIWVAVPNRGHSVQIPPNGAITPTHRKNPHNATESADPIKLLVQDEVSLKVGTALPIRSWIMNRSTRVPASTVVRMNSASNRIAK